jgi:hypothetical protein
MTTASLSQMLSDFLDGARVVVVAEDGVIAFDGGIEMFRLMDRGPAHHQRRS